MYTILPFLIAATMIMAGFNPLFAATQEDVKGITSSTAEDKVVSENCLECHNRKKADVSKNVEQITRQMEGNGTSSTEAERQVMCHFWQKNPLKQD